MGPLGAAARLHLFGCGRRGEGHPSVLHLHQGSGTFTAGPAERSPLRLRFPTKKGAGPLGTEAGGGGLVLVRVEASRQLSSLNKPETRCKYLARCTMA
ncbi:hypothetical protein NHX12_021820, partial [Muraenolepis orangiensis]